MAGGIKLHYQLNLFLEKVEFPNYGKVKFKIENEYRGEGYLYCDLGEEIGNLLKKGTFNLQKFEI